MIHPSPLFAQPFPQIAVGILELKSIARGFLSCDAMLKDARVDLIQAQPVCPGKYIILISGEVADVESSVRAGIAESGDYLTDHLVIPNVDSQIFPAISATNPIPKLDALGVIETFSVASSILAGDTAVKAADITLMEIRMAHGIAGKSYLTMTGDVGAVKTSVKAGIEAIKDTGMLTEAAVIPYPHPGMRKAIV